MDDHRSPTYCKMKARSQYCTTYGHSLVPCGGVTLLFVKISCLNSVVPVLVTVLPIVLSGYEKAVKALEGKVECLGWEEAEIAAVISFE